MAANTVAPEINARPRRIEVDDLPVELDALQRDLSAGRVVVLLRGGTAIAELRALATPQSGPLEKNFQIDFMARLRSRFGDQVFPSGTGTELVRTDRDARG